MSARPSPAALAPFRIRSFRFQWPADLATSWAFEMETIILGWFVLVETRSVLMLTLYASLQYLGTLLAPFFGVAGDRIGQRNLLALMRGTYATLASLMMILAYTGLLTPVHAMVIAALSGLVRPSDIGMRVALIGEVMPPGLLMGAMGIQRTTQDSAKIVGALTGAGMVAALGIGPAYTVVAALYAASMLLTRHAGSAHVRAPTPAPAGPAPVRASPWADLRAGVGYVWRTPFLRAVMCLAFLLNLTAFPLFFGLMPYVAREVYQTTQTVLGYMVATGAAGALLGSIAMSRYGSRVRPARWVIFFSIGWYAALLCFAQTRHPAAGLPFLFLAGISHSMSQVPMATMLLRNSDERYRGRIMGIRMMAIYGNLPGLLLAGPLITAIGYAGTATGYCLFGIACVITVAAVWRNELWRAGAPANRR